MTKLLSCLEDSLGNMKVDDNLQLNYVKKKTNLKDSYNNQARKLNELNQFKTNDHETD